MTSANVTTLAIVGAGTMGQGIAHIAALNGLQTHLFDVQPESLQCAMNAIGQTLQTGVAKGKLTAAQKARALEHLHPSTSLQSAVAQAQLVIEAVPESMALKAQVFADIAQYVKSTTILATNTSSLSVTAIAAAVANPERVVGMHFFNPPHTLKLLEIVRGEHTAEDIVQAVQQLGRRLGRDMVVVQDSPGFASSRLGVVLGLEAMRMVQEGVASAEDIDQAMESGYRHPMGPLRLSDLVGLDVRLAIAEYLYNELGGEQFRPPQILKRLVRAGKLGKKTGAGFYRW